MTKPEELKFRAYDKERQCWVDRRTCEHHDVVTTPVLNGHFNLEGVFDGHGRGDKIHRRLDILRFFKVLPHPEHVEDDLYEGDVLKISPIGSDIQLTSVVIYATGLKRMPRFCWGIPVDDKHMPVASYNDIPFMRDRRMPVGLMTVAQRWKMWKEDIHLVGNIYDNPELLDAIAEERRHWYE